MRRLGFARSRFPLGAELLDQRLAVPLDMEVAGRRLGAARLGGLGHRRIELALRGEAERHRVLRLDVGDIPVAPLADRLDRGAGGADQLADLAVREIGMVADQPRDPVRRTRGPRYTPVSKRQDKPDGIYWIIRNHPEVTDGQISKLIGTTRTTIASIRDRTHWNMANIQPKDPVTLGLTSQRELDAAVAKAQKAAGMEARVDTRLDSDRSALIEELRAERDQHARDAEAALAAAEAGEVDTSDEIVPGIKDPFKRPA